MYEDSYRYQHLLQSVTHPDDVLRNKPVWQLLLHNTNLCLYRCSDAPDSPYSCWPKSPRYGPSPPDSPYCSYSPTSPAHYFGHRPSSTAFDHRDVMVLSLRNELQDARVSVACLCRTKLAGTHSRDELTQALHTCHQKYNPRPSDLRRHL